MLYEPTSSYNKEKEGENPSYNRLLNLKILTTNMEKFLVCQQCAHEKVLQMKLEEARYQENFISYIEAYYYLTTEN